MTTIEEREEEEDSEVEKKGNEDDSIQKIREARPNTDFLSRYICRIEKSNEKGSRPASIPPNDRAEDNLDKESVINGLRGLYLMMVSLFGKQLF